MERSPQKVKLEDFLRQGVDWDQLDALKPQARELGFNKYSWGRSQGASQSTSQQPSIEEMLPPPASAASAGFSGSISQSSLESTPVGSGNHRRTSASGFLSRQPPVAPSHRQHTSSAQLSTMQTNVRSLVHDIAQDNEPASKRVRDEELRALIADMYSGSSDHGNLHDDQSTESMIVGGARQIESLLHPNASPQSRSPQGSCLQTPSTTPESTPTHGNQPSSAKQEPQECVSALADPTPVSSLAPVSSPVDSHTIQLQVHHLVHGDKQQVWDALTQLHASTWVGDPAAPSVRAALAFYDLSGAVHQLLCLCSRPLDEESGSWVDEAVGTLSNLSWDPASAARIVHEHQWATLLRKCPEPKGKFVDPLMYDRVVQDILGLLVNITDEQTLLINNGSTREMVIAAVEDIISILKEYGTSDDPALCNLSHRVWCNLWASGVLHV